jgi:hypothetical protein
VVDKSMEEFQQYIYGVDFPADKEEVAAVAEDRNAPQQPRPEDQERKQGTLREL